MMYATTTRKQYAPHYDAGRRADISASERMEQVLDGIYKMLGWKFQRTDRSLDIQGVDVIMQNPVDTRFGMMVDEKTATRYWDRELSTYCCELTNDCNRSRAGWFAPEQNSFYKTTHLEFVWVRSEESELWHITSVELMLVKKKDLQNYFVSLVGKENLKDGTAAFCELALRNSNRIELAPGVVLKKNLYGPEKSVNVIFSKEILAQVAIFARKFEGSEINGRPQYQSFSFGPGSRAVLPRM